MIGGAEVLSFHLTREYIRRGHDVLVVAACEASDRAGRQTYAGIDIVRLEFGAALARRDLSAIRGINDQLAGLLDDFRPDVLHLNDALLSSFFFQRGGSTGDLPRILTLHSTIRSDKGTLQDRLIADADRVVAVSQAQADAIAAAVPAASAKLSVIRNALPMPSMMPTEVPKGSARLLCLGRLLSDKGFDVAIRAMALLRSRGVAATLTIAGDGPEHGSLVSLATELGLASQVEFVGWVMPDDVPGLIDGSAIVVVPSRWAEPFGLVALQAAQMARPAIVSNVGGLPEIVEHGRSGLVVEAEEADQLAGAIMQLLGDPPAARSFGAAARQRACDRFDFSRLVSDYENVLREATLLRRGPQSG
ncbi:glycosyltransferase family 4 protein [Bradyrhizobium sp.]|uniref:glycosyltransferase family 4 protein n=1 Tax=Bradyrhizobium sp. TaxID=376 RepID=UPI0039E5D3E1